MAPTAHVDLDRPIEAPRDPRAVIIGVVAFLAVMAVGAALYLAKFQVEAWIQQASIYALLIAFAITFRFTVPSSRLTPTQLRVREGRRAAALVGSLGAAASLGLAAAAAELKSGDDWLFLGFLVLNSLGIGAMINTRFDMGGS